MNNNENRKDILFVILLFVFILLVALFNFIVDPYYIFRDSTIKQFNNVKTHKYSSKRTILYSQIKIDDKNKDTAFTGNCLLSHYGIGLDNVAFYTIPVARVTEVSEIIKNISLIAPNIKTIYWGVFMDDFLNLDSDEYRGSGVEEFQYRGGSPGGARPKIFVRYDEAEWLVKFRAKMDSKHVGAEEYRYSLLAKECGIDMPETRLFENKYFGVKRFDRVGGKKLHVVSVAGLIGADYRVPSIDYLHIFQVCAALTYSVVELWKVYRVMVFNCLIDNKDDHAKNFAFIYQDGEWHFSPAFDLLPSAGMNGFRTTSINDSIEPTSNDIFVVAEKVGLNKKEAIEIYDTMKTILGRK